MDKRTENNDGNIAGRGARFLEQGKFQTGGGAGSIDHGGSRPFVFRYYYFNILQVKYWYYCGVVIAAAVIYVIMAVIFWNRDRKWCDGALLKGLKSNLSLKSLTVAEWAMLAFLLASAISTLQSEYVYESFWGNEGRFVGLFMIMLYTISLFLS